MRSRSSASRRQLRPRRARRSIMGYERREPLLRFDGHNGKKATCYGGYRPILKGLGFRSICAAPIFFDDSAQPNMGAITFGKQAEVRCVFRQASRRCPHGGGLCCAGVRRRDGIFWRPCGGRLLREQQSSYRVKSDGLPDPF